MPRVHIRVEDLPPPVAGLDVFGAVQVRRDVEQVTRLGIGPMTFVAEFEIVGQAPRSTSATR